LWGTVLTANLVGALLISWVFARTGVFSADVRATFTSLAQASVGMSFGLVLLRGVFAGWLVAMLVWMLPFAETARFSVILSITWLIGVAGFTHVVAGAIEALFLAFTGGLPWSGAWLGYILPALLGNIIGGVALVAVINHAQVVS
jgi:formate/nitrite transporter FocA (FNT family)